VGLPSLTPKPVLGLPNWNRPNYPEEIYDLVAMMLLTIWALSPMKEYNAKLTPVTCNNACVC